MQKIYCATVRGSSSKVTWVWHNDIALTDWASETFSTEQDRKGNNFNSRDVKVMILTVSSYLELYLILLLSLELFIQSYWYECEKVYISERLAKMNKCSWPYKERACRQQLNKRTPTYRVLYSIFIFSVIVLAVFFVREIAGAETLWSLCLALGFHAS